MNCVAPQNGKRKMRNAARTLFVPKINGVTDQALHAGGNANNSVKVGVFYANANNTASNVNSNIGGRLSLFVPKAKIGTVIHASWQNTKQSLNRSGRDRRRIGGEISR